MLNTLTSVLAFSERVRCGAALTVAWQIKSPLPDPHEGTPRRLGRYNDRYVEDRSYVLMFPQLMGSTKGGWLLGGKTVKERTPHIFGYLGQID